MCVWCGVCVCVCCHCVPCDCIQLMLLFGVNTFPLTSPVWESGMKKPPSYSFTGSKYAQISHFSELNLQRGPGERAVSPSVHPKKETVSLNRSRRGLRLLRDHRLGSQVGFGSRNGASAHPRSSFVSPARKGRVSSFGIRFGKAG